MTEIRNAYKNSKLKIQKSPPKEDPPLAETFAF
jgi:hypothetical protein